MTRKKDEHWTVKYFIDLCLWVILGFAAFTLLAWLNGCSHLPDRVEIEGQAHLSRDSCLLHLANVESTLSRPNVLYYSAPPMTGNTAYVQKKREECEKLP